MNNSKTLTYFNKTASSLIKKLGKKALYNTTIEKVGNPIFKKQWHGVNSQDQIVWKNGYQIINTDVSSKSGTHWIALYITKNRIYVYDSFGRQTSKLLKILTKQAKKHGRTIIDAEYDPEQFGTTEICGHLCLAWLIVVKQFGVKKALTI